MGDSHRTTPSTALRRKLYVPPPKRVQDEPTFEDLPISSIIAAARDSMQNRTTDPGFPPNR